MTKSSHKMWIVSEQGVKKVDDIELIHVNIRGRQNSKLSILSPLSSRKDAWESSLPQFSNFQIPVLGQSKQSVMRN